MYDELIKRLRASCESCKLWDGYKCCLKGECSAQTRLQAADAIEELLQKVQQLPRWIPVEERLPDGGQWVLCMCQQGIVDVLKYINGIAGPWYKDSRHVYMEGFVTHWMPLPAPPKED